MNRNRSIPSRSFRTVRALGTLLLAASISLAASACGEKGAPEGGGTGDPATTTFASALGIELSQMTRSPSGLYYRDLMEGTGTEAASGSSVTVEYTVWLPDGKQMDSGSFPFTLGTHSVVAGFEEGVTGMRVGGVRKLVVPPALGYGARGNGPIPGNVVLVFQVTLKSVS